MKTLRKQNKSNNLVSLKKTLHVNYKKATSSDKKSNFAASVMFI